MPKGEKNKLTTGQKIEILDSYGKESGYQVAKRFGISHTMVYKIWKKQASNQEKPNPLDISIFKKMIPVFIENELKVDLDPDEIERIQKLSKEAF